jgi:hypothetical protein
LDNDPDSPGYGDVLRKSYWGDANGPDAIRYNETRSGNYTFNLYLQLTPNHQFNWYYMQGFNFQNQAGALNENPPENGTDVNTRSWNISYKAVLGAVGLLDVRYGRSQNFYDYKTRGNESARIYTYRSYWAGGGNTDLYYGSWENIANFSPTVNFVDGSQASSGTGFVGSGMIDDYWTAWGTGYRGANSFQSIGADGVGSYGSGVDSINLNYQHFLDFKGQHTIDIGFNMNAVDAPAIPSGARYLVSPVGQISYDIDEWHIGNVFSGSYAGGNGKMPANYYKGKYIVFDTHNTTIGQLEPHVLLRAMNTYAAGVWSQTWLNDGPIIELTNNGMFDRINSQLTGWNIEYLPFMREYWGSDTGDMTTTTTSYYINDMWTINEKHSLMIGLRADSFELKDSARTVHSYIKVTPRLEYKYDLQGDQKHLFSGSFAQFHQMAAANLYWPFIEKKWGNRSNRLWTGDAVAQSVKKQGYYLVDKEDLFNPKNYGLEYQSELSGSLFGSVDKDFRPPTSTEFSVGYRHLFANGGYIRISYNNRTWSDLYDFFPSEVFEWENPNTGAKSNRIKATLKNTDDYTRTYNGIEIQWDFNITKKISFGGNYTYSRFEHNQTRLGSSESWLDGGDVTATGISLETPWWFAEALNREVVVNGEVVAGPFGRDTWSPMQKQGAEFSTGYYIIFNLSQGRARSNFTLRGTYTGSSTSYDYVNFEIGRAILEGYNVYPGASANQLNNTTAAYFGEYTTIDSFGNHLTYNLNMPINRNLSWFLNVNVSNVFNHIPKAPIVKGGNVGMNNSVGPLRPWAVQRTATAYDPVNWNNALNPFRQGWNLSDVGLRANYLDNRSINIRSITMSTGIRF